MGSSQSKINEAKPPVQDLSAINNNPGNKNLDAVEVPVLYPPPLPQQAIVQQQESTEPLRMPSPTTYTCNQCGMKFPSDEALFKHRTRFCLGRKTSDDTGRTFATTDYSGNSHSNGRPSSTDKKRYEINEWKNQRSMLQTIQDMEDRILRDSQKTQQLANDLKKRTIDYQQILSEYERLEVQERNLLREMFNLQGQYGSLLTDPNNVNSAERQHFDVLQRQNARLEEQRRSIQDRLEQFIASEHRPIAYTNYEPYRLLRDMKDQQDSNERALESIRRRLNFPDGIIPSRSEIPSLPYIKSARRTSSVSIRRSLQDDYLSTSRLDMNPRSIHRDLDRRMHQYEYNAWMKDYPEPLKPYSYRSNQAEKEDIKVYKKENKELKNQLDDIRRQYDTLDSRTRQLEFSVGNTGYRGSKSSDGVHQRSYSPSKLNRYGSPKSLNGARFQQAYINNDNQTLDMRTNPYHSSLPNFNEYAQTKPNQSSYPSFPSTIYPSASNPYLAVSTAYPAAPTNYPAAPTNYPAASTNYPAASTTYPAASNNYPAASTTYPSAPNSYAYAPGNSSSTAYAYPSVPYGNPSTPYNYSSAPTTYAPGSTTHGSNSITPFRPSLPPPTIGIIKPSDPFVPQPYIIHEGFAVFYDFLIHLPPTIDRCRLITCLHHEQSGLGEPSQLAIAKCEFIVDANTGEHINIVLIALKQPVPNCPPEQKLTILVEVLTVTKERPNGPFETNGWTKIPLFDHQNRLLSGRWKLPLHALPVKESESQATINSLPRFGVAEIYYRLVNGQHVQDQSNLRVAAQTRDLYFYPPQRVINTNK